MATQNVLAFTKGLSKKLQGRYVDVAYAHQEIPTIKTAVQEVTSNVDVCHEQIFKQATLLAGSVGIEETFPRIASRQQHCQNIPAQNCSDYYRLTRNLTIPLVDHLLSEFTA